MARTSTYLNFPRETEAAFLFYRSVFGGEFVMGTDAPPSLGYTVTMGPNVRIHA